MNRIRATVPWWYGCFGKNGMIIQFTPTKPPPYQNGCSPKDFCSNHSCCEMVSAALKHVPQSTATTFAFSSVFFFLLCPTSSQTKFLEKLLRTIPIFFMTFFLSFCSRLRLSDDAWSYTNCSSSITGDTRTDTETEPGRSHLKGQCHEIFAIFFYQKKTLPGPHMNSHKRFCKICRFRVDILVNVSRRSR